ncbi:RES domain-containing protein [Rhizobium sp. BK068]|uniref:RES family NAD+ phosphorylase n=1 Tax=Rhizobium sp. BK068 TaxID=2512130 RepID=UPI0010F335A6|nr:RES domain-containing protein [Rhizobium sp. BK068]TCM76351.1 RES domain-containing protein [Rhizobium sp. BK068]
MKITRIGPNAVIHRYLTPKWAFLPTSGAGAAIDGGRFNRPGVEALYLSLAPQTALEEYRQGASITPPATLAAYKITLDEVADLSEGFDPLHGMSLELDGTVHGERSLGSTRRCLRRGSWLTRSFRPAVGGFFFHHSGTPAKPTW